LSFTGVVLEARSFDLRSIVEAQRGLWYIGPQFVGFVSFLIAGIAETHRLPFDLPEAESELVAGFHTEYSSLKFGMFFVGEYVGIVLISAMITTLFLGGWLGPVLPPVLWFLIKTGFFIAFFILLRALLSNLRTLFLVFLHLFHRRETILYPEQKPYLPPRFRGRIILSRDPDGA